MERLNLDLLKWGRVPDAIRDTIDKLHDGIWADQAKKALREMTKSYSESAKTPIIELGLKEIQRVSTAGVQRSPAETGDSDDGRKPSASFNFFPTTLHLSHEEIEHGKKLRLQSKTKQDAFGTATTEPKSAFEVRTDSDDTYDTTKIVLEMKISTIRMVSSYKLPHIHSRSNNHRPSDLGMMGAAHHQPHKPRNRQTIPTIWVKEYTKDQ